MPFSSFGFPDSSTGLGPVRLTAVFLLATALILPTQARQSETDPPASIEAQSTIPRTPESPSSVIAAVTPASVNVTVTLGEGPTTVNVVIENSGTDPLIWQVDETSTPNRTFWDQPVNGTSGIVSDFFIGSNAGAYSAADFVIATPTTLGRIFAAGFDNSNSLAAQPAITWAIYADDAGVPAGHPEDGTGGASALWTFSAAVDAPGVDIANSDITLDLLTAGQDLTLDPGTYWLSVFPSYDVTGAGGARWNWFQAAQVGAQTQLISPVVFGVSNWTGLTSLGVSFSDTAFTLDQVVECGADWLTVTPGSGEVAGASSVELSLELDETGLDIGETIAYLCIATNDPANALIVVPVSLTVEEAPITGLSADNDGPVVIGQTVNLTAASATGSNISYSWDFGDGNSGSGPAPSHDYLAPGTYTATVTASNSVSSEEASTEVRVLGLYTVGGTISGLLGNGLVLQNDATGNLAVNAADVSFTFPAQVEGSDYDISVIEQPSNPIQTCSVTNGSGQVGDADVTNVLVTCVTEPAQLTLSLGSLNFGTLETGETASDSFNITNTGTGELIISELIGPGVPFSVTGGTCTLVPVTLLPGQSCDIEITFAAPPSPGTFSSELQIISNADSNPDTVTLGASALPPALPVPALDRYGLLLLMLLMAGLAWRQAGRSTF